MATRAEIKKDIENTRTHISDTIEELSNTIHKKTDIKEQIKKNPLAGIAVATAFGFTVANMSSPLGRRLFKIILRSATAAAYGYFTKKGIDILTKNAKI